MLGKAHPLGGKAIECRGLDVLLPQKAQISIAEIICKDKNDIGWCWGNCSSVFLDLKGREQEATCKQANAKDWRSHTLN
jgi:hypothetical protein